MRKQTQTTETDYSTRAQTMKTPQSYSPYYTDHILCGVTVADPQDIGPSYVTLSFNRLIRSKEWTRARVTFCGALLSGSSIGSARLHTLHVHGIL